MDIQNTYIYYWNSINSSFLYKKTGIETPSNMLYVRKDWKEKIYVPEFEFSYFKKYSRMKEICNFNILYNVWDTFYDSIERMILNQPWDIIIPSSFPLWLYNRLLLSGTKVEIKDSDFIKYNVIKDENEIKIMKKNWNEAKKCFRYIEKLLKESYIDNDRI